MKKSNLLLLAIISMSKLAGQGVRVENHTAETEKHSVKTFNFIDSSFNLTSKKTIATLKGFSLNNNKVSLETLFYYFKKTANKIGANAFVIDSISNTVDTTFITLSIFYLNEEDIKSNLQLYPRNMVYVIGDIKKNQNSKTLKFNDRKLELNPMEYFAYQNQVGNEATISIGGFLGATVWIVGKEGRLPEYFSVTGFAVGTGSYNTASVTFNNGRIYPVDLNFGQFLVTILKKQN